MFGDILKNLVSVKYNTYSEFAELCNMSKGHLNDIFKGRILPKREKLDLMIENLQPLSKEKEKNLLMEWSFDKGEGILREEFSKIKNQNNDMVKVLSRVESELKLAKEVDQLKQYEDFYNLLFKNLTSLETKAVLNAILKELKIIALDNDKQDELKTKFDKLELIINKIK